MDILNPFWHENNEHQKIMDTLTALPETELPSETNMELVRATYSKTEAAAVESHI